VCILQQVVEPRSRQSSNVGLSLVGVVEQLEVTAAEPTLPRVPTVVLPPLAIPSDAKADV
jgi:hypothetical protein